MHGINKLSPIYLTGIFFTIILSIWAAAHTVVINPDGICYLQSAESMASGLQVAAHLCDQAHWPFYSALIYGLAHFTGFSFLSSAYFINLIFSIIATISFISILSDLKGSRRILWLGTFVFLMSHELNLVRSDIIRDHGFWAFYLLSVLLLLRFFHQPRWNYALLWSLSLVAASLFRIEGAFFLLGLPLVAWFRPGYRFSGFLKLNLLTLCAVLGLGLWLWFHPEISADQLGRIGEIKFQLIHGLAAIKQNFQLSAQAIAQHVLNRYSAQEATLVLSLVLIAWYLINVIITFSIIYTVLVLYAWFRGALVLDSASRWVLGGYLLIATAITGGFLTEHMFLSKRYIVALLLILMLWIPFALDKLYEKNKSIFGVAVLLVVLSSLGGILNFGYSKQYIRDAGNWIEKNVPPQAKLYSNDYQVMFYSKHFGREIFNFLHEYAKQKSLPSVWNQYDYVALRFNKKDIASKTQFINQDDPVALFSNKRGDEVLIYQVSERKKL